MNNAAATASNILLSLVTHNTPVIFRAEGAVHQGRVLTLPTDRDPSGHPVGAYLVATPGLGNFRIHPAAILRIAGPITR